MSQYKDKVINRTNSSKDFENCRVDHTKLEANNSIYDDQVCENCMNENSQKKEVCTYCSSLQKPKETHLFHKNESSKRDYDTNKLSKLNAKEIELKTSHNLSLRGFSIDSTSFESYESAEKVAMKLYCKECIDLSRFRIIQNKLVCITGLAPEIASEKVLQKPEYLGQYGKIAKILVNNNSGAGFTACVVYCNEDEALTAILALDQYNLSEKTIRAYSGNLLCCLNPSNELPYICAGGCVEVNQLERDCEKLSKDDLSSKSLQQMAYAPKLQHLLFVLSKQSHEQRIEESMFPSTVCIIQNIKKILSEMKTEEQPSLNLRAEEKEGETYNSKADSKPIRKSLKLPDRKSENQFSYLPTLEKFVAMTKERELACTETMTVVSTTETCETNRSKYTENDIDTTINDEEDLLRKEFDTESPLSTMKFSHSEFKVQPEELTIKRFISGNDSARNSIAGSQKFDLLASPSKSLEEENELLVDTDKKISEAYLDKSRQRNASRFAFAQLCNVKEEFEFEEIALTIKKHTTPIELKVETSETYFDFGEKPENSIKISENEHNMMQIETFLDKLNKSSASKFKHFNLNANHFIPITKNNTQAKKPEPKKEQPKASPSSDSIKKKAGLLSSSPAISTSTHLKSGKPNKINNNYYETIENNYFPYYYPSVYETDIIADTPSYIQDWGYGPPTLGAIALSYQDLYFLPFY